jgi:hypothetical protein
LPDIDDIIPLNIIFLQVADIADVHSHCVETKQKNIPDQFKSSCQFQIPDFLRYSIGKAVCLILWDLML